MELRTHSIKVWEDRVPAIHGEVTLYTLWLDEGGRNPRLVGGVTAHQLGEFISKNKFAPPG